MNSDQKKSILTILWQFLEMILGIGKKHIEKNN